MGKTLNNGGVKFVRQTVSLKDSEAVGATSKTYIVRKGSLKAGVKRTTDTDENDCENKQAFSTTIPEGTLTLQFTKSTDSPPIPLQELTLKTSKADDVTVIVGEVADDFGAADASTVTVSIYEKQPDEAP